MMIELPVVEAKKAIGKIDISTGEITVNHDFYIQYSCEVTGDCCREFQVPISFFDIERIKDHGYSIDEIIEDPQNQQYDTNIPTTISGNGNHYQLKDNKESTHCTFLKNNECSIHEFKPFGCRIFPFQLEFLGDEVFQVLIHEENFCPSVNAVKEAKSQNKVLLKNLREEIENELQRRVEYFE